MMGSLSDMVLRGQAIQVYLEPLDRLESLMVEVQEWKESAATEFLQKDSPLTLLEVNHHVYRLELLLQLLLFFLWTVNASQAKHLLCSCHVTNTIFFTLYKNIEDIFSDHLDARVDLL